MRELYGTANQPAVPLTAKIQTATRWLPRGGGWERKGITSYQTSGPADFCCTGTACPLSIQNVQLPDKERGKHVHLPPLMYLKNRPRLPGKRAVPPPPFLGERGCGEGFFVYRTGVCVCVCVSLWQGRHLGPRSSTSNLFLRDSTRMPVLQLSLAGPRTSRRRGQIESQRETHAAAPSLPSLPASGPRTLHRRRREKGRERTRDRPITFRQQQPLSPSLPACLCGRSVGQHVRLM